ncbi:hypothetical protein Peur_010549 [Populus x canadensis]
MEKRVNLCILELVSLLNFRSEGGAWARLCRVSLSVHRINDVLAAYRAVPGGGSNAELGTGEPFSRDCQFDGCWSGLVRSELDKNLITGTSSTPWTYMAMDFAIPMVSAIRIIMPVKSTTSWGR